MRAFVYERYGLNDVPQALQDLGAGRVCGKAVISLDAEA